MLTAYFHNFPSLDTHPHFPHSLSAVVLDVHRHADILAVGIPSLIQACPQADTSVLQEEWLVHRTLRSTATAAKRTRCITANHPADRAAATGRGGEWCAANAANADGANAAGNSSAIILWSLKTTKGRGLMLLVRCGVGARRAALRFCRDLRVFVALFFCCSHLTGELALRERKIQKGRRNSISY